MGKIVPGQQKEARQERKGEKKHIQVATVLQENTTS
jgi:hypothetical protein